MPVYECPRCGCYYLDYPVCPNCGYEADGSNLRRLMSDEVLG